MVQIRFSYNWENNLKILPIFQYHNPFFCIHDVLITTIQKTTFFCFTVLLISEILSKKTRDNTIEYVTLLGDVHNEILQ